MSNIYRIVSGSLLVCFASITSRAQTAAPKQADPRLASRCEVAALDQKNAQQYLLSLPRLPKDARRFNDVEFAHTPQGPVLLDLYLPAKADGPLPLIVWVHGGGWHSKPEYRKSAPGRVVARGYALASISYRDSNDAKFPAQIEDCKAGIRWLRAHAKEYGIDPNRIGVWGSSAGGHLYALLGTSGAVKDLEGSGGNPNVSSRVQAACDFSGPTDFFQIRETAATSNTLSRLRQRTTELLGGTLEQHRDLVVKANPITYAQSDAPPMLIAHGDLDPLVPVEQSELLYEALKALGAEVKLCVVKGGGHSFISPELDRIVDAFFDEHLKEQKMEEQKTRGATR